MLLTWMVGTATPNVRKRSIEGIVKNEYRLWAVKPLSWRSLCVIELRALHEELVIQIDTFVKKIPHGRFLTRFLPLDSFNFMTLNTCHNSCC